MVVIADDQALNLGELTAADHRPAALCQAQQLAGGGKDLHADVIRAVPDPGLGMVEQDDGVQADRLAEPAQELLKKLWRFTSPQKSHKSGSSTTLPTKNPRTRRHLAVHIVTVLK